MPNEIAAGAGSLSEGHGALLGPGEVAMGEYGFGVDSVCKRDVALLETPP